jgi:hypothetical protein
MYCTKKYGTVRTDSYTPYLRKNHINFMLALAATGTLRLESNKRGARGSL